jgi:Cohesin domain
VKRVLEHRLLVVSGVGLAVVLALSAWLPATDEAADVASGKANANPALQATASTSPVDRQKPAIPTTADPMPLLAPRSATTVFAVPIMATAPQKLIVGEMNDLVVGVGANAGVEEITFTVQFDPHVLQVRAGTEGDWAVDAGRNARFGAEISDKEDRVRIRSTASGRGVGIAGGSVATVQFQAVAPGTTSVMITDVVLKDLAGRSIPSAVSQSNLQIAVDSVPPPQPKVGRPHRVVAVEPPAATTEDGD